MNSIKKIVIVMITIVFIIHYQSHGCSAVETSASNVLGMTQGGGSTLPGPTYPITQDSYFTDDYGNILMFVNVLGMVGRTGQFIVRENADFVNILAITGGVLDGANMRNVLVIRHKPDDNGKSLYIVDVKKFYKKGDRSAFVVLKPNDTIIFPDKAISLAKIAKALSMVSPFVYIYDLMNTK